ncbi:MAG: HAD-IA family hydrolase [Proteobacteria bacterium]|nr:HAD-IA family hydrolase [Pseudomonadota bacterium]
MEPRFKLLVFDWDGTLMDSEAHIVHCMRHAIHDNGLPSKEDNAIRNIIGLGLGEALHTLFPEGDSRLHEALTQRYRHHFLSDSHSPSELFAGAEVTLSGLSDTGYLLAVATGKGRHGLDHVLEQTGLKKLFHASRCVDEAPSKPHPQMLFDLMDALDVTPDDTLMIGDTEYDMHMARNAGVPALGVSYGVHGRERLLQCGALDCLDAIHELPAWLVRREAVATTGVLPGYIQGRKS